MNHTTPTRMATPNPESESDAYFGRRIITENQIELHWHQFYEFDFVDDGHGTHILNGVEKEFSRGTLSILSPYDFHSYNLDLPKGDRLSTYSFHFSESFPDPSVAARLRLISGKQLQLRDEEGYRRLLGEFSLLFEECASDRRDRDEMVRNILSRIVLYACRSSESKSGQGPTGKVFPEIRFIEENFRQQIGVADVARAAGFSEDYFSKLFKKRYGITFQEYLSERRLQWAYRLVLSSDRSIIDIAFDSGFNSHTYFCRCFKQRYGVSPLEARRNAAGRTTPQNRGKAE